MLADPAKAAAVARSSRSGRRANVWAYENPDAWIDYYYVKDQGVTADDGRRIVRNEDKPAYPADWTKAIAWQQETADLLSDGGFVPAVAAEDLFDRRFETIAADAVPAAYRE